MLREVLTINKHFLKKRASDIVLSSGDLKFLCFRKIPIPNKISLKLSGTDKNFDFFDLLRTFSSHLPAEVCKISSKESLGLSDQSLLNVAILLTPKRFKKPKLHKNGDVELFGLLWSHSEVFLKQKAATFSSKM